MNLKTLNTLNKIKRNWKNYLIIILIILFLGNILLSSNISKYSNNSFENFAPSLEKTQSTLISPVYQQRATTFAPNSKVRKIIKNANINLKTVDYDKSYAQIKNSLNSFNVLILSETETKNINNDRSSTLNIKVESLKLNQLIDKIKKFGIVNNLNIYSNDVTSTYSDYTKREQRYKKQINKYSLMLEKNITITEEIQIQQRIDNLENLIFNLKNNKLSIDENSKYSTLNINLIEKPSIFTQINFLGFKDLFKEFLSSLSSAINYILILLGFILPFGIIYGIYRIFKKFNK